MSITNRYSFAFSFITSRLPRITLSVVAVLAWAAPADAEPRLVRIIWDIGQASVYYRAEPRATVGHDGFVVPGDATQAGSVGFIKQTADAFLRKGDRVRIYVVNYNSVSHVWHESSMVEQVALSPSLVGPLLNALTLAVSGAAKPPTSGFMFDSLSATVDKPSDHSCPLTALRNDLAALIAAAKGLDAAATTLVGDATRLNLGAAVKKIAKIPTNDRLWLEFDTRRAWTAVTSEATVFGSDFATDFQLVADQIQPVQKAIDDANVALLAFDREVALPSASMEGCAVELKPLIAKRDNIASFMREVASDESPLRVAITRFEAASKLWAEFARKLADPAWSDDAVEYILKEPIAEGTVLRADAVFVSPEKGVMERIQRNVVIGVLPRIPILVISSGVGYNDFRFKKLQVVKAATTADDGTVATKNRLETTDDTSWNRLMPVWIQSIRVLELPDAGVYGTFGTTPDRNIFKNAIVGGSVFVPRWRTLLTAGTIMVRGHVQKDLDPVIAEFSGAGGFALPDVSATNVPLPKTPLHKSFYWSVTFGLVSF